MIFKISAPFFALADEKNLSLKKEKVKCSGGSTSTSIKKKFKLRHHILDIYYSYFSQIRRETLIFSIVLFYHWMNNLLLVKYGMDVVEIYINWMVAIINFELCCH